MANRVMFAVGRASPLTKEQVANIVAHADRGVGPSVLEAHELDATIEALRKRAEDAERWLSESRTDAEGLAAEVVRMHAMMVKLETDQKVALASLARVRGELFDLCDAVEEETQSLDAHDADNFSWVQSSVWTFHAVVAEARAEAEEAIKGEAP